MKIAIPILLAFTVLSANAKSGMKELDRLAQTTPSDIGAMLACGQKHSKTYTDLAHQINKKMLELVGAMGYDVEAFAEGHHKKALVVADIMKDPSHEECESNLFFANKRYLELERALKKVKKVSR